MWSFTGISSDGYNALYTCKPFLRLQASAALWGLLLGVDRADLRLWQGHFKDLCPSLPATLTYWTLSCTLGTVGPGRWGGTSSARCPALAAAPADGVSISAETTRASLITRQSKGRVACLLLAIHGVGSRGCRGGGERMCKVVEGFDPWQRHSRH